MSVEDAQSVCVILPTRNEEANIEEVLTRLDRLGVCSEIVVVDDGDDRTSERAEQCGVDLNATVIVRHRMGKDRTGGLGTAIVDGIAASVSDCIVVMDADLQHPPELVPTLVSRLRRDSTELVIASRFNWDNVIAGLSPTRRLVSRAAGVLAFRLFPAQLRSVSDPMSGFFALQRRSLRIERLEPMGYKILLEILGTHPELAVAEVPFSFGRRVEGESKAGTIEAARYMRHLFDLRRRTRSAAAAEPAAGGFEAATPGVVP